MAWKEDFWVDPLDIAAVTSRFDPGRASSMPAPEDGIRLMRAFLSIREPAARQAVIEYATELSSPALWKQ